MFLKRLEINGFKSFAHKTILTFESGITSVVGPNGSGKSNIADALRWVMGEQSMKLLRGKRSEDVIFAGSDSKAKLGMTEVIAVFDNQDGRINLDASEISVGRRLFRNGESAYLVNGQPARLLDIQEVLVRSGIGQEHLTVIGQGMIDQLIIAGPQGIKEIIEEASGIKPYYAKRERALRRLQATQQNLLRAEDLLKEIEPRLRSLRRQAKRMEEREVVEQELHHLYQLWYGKQITTVQQELSELSGKLAVFEKDAAQSQEELSQFRALVEQHEGEAKTREAHTRNLQTELDQVESERTKLLEEQAALAGRMAAMDGLQARESLARLRAEHGKLTRERQHLAEKLARMEGGDHTPYFAIRKALDALAHRFEELLADWEESLDAAAMLSQARAFREELRAVQTKLVTPFGKGNTSAGSALAGQNELAEGLRKLDVDIARMEGELAVLTKSAGVGADVDFEAIAARQKTLHGEVTRHEARRDALREQLTKLRLADEEARKNLFAEEQKYRRGQESLLAVREERAKLLAEKAKFEERKANLLREIESRLGSEQASALLKEQVHSIPADCEEKIAKLERQLAMTGGVDEQMQTEYRETESRFQFLSQQAEDLRSAIRDLHETILELDSRIHKTFHEAFSKVSEKFSEYFRILFGGGRASMYVLKERTSARAPEEAEAESEVGSDSDHGAATKEEVVGIEIRAVPPGKKLAVLHALSGGERALTSIAFLCALLVSYPSPLVVLDEVDAALDEANSIRFAKILELLAAHTQVITITHNRETMRRSHTLYGVTMGEDGISKVLSIKLEKAEALAQ